MRAQVARAPAQRHQRILRAVPAIPVIRCGGHVDQVQLAASLGRANHRRGIRRPHQFVPGAIQHHAIGRRRSHVLAESFLQSAGGGSQIEGNLVIVDWSNTNRARHIAVHNRSRSNYLAQRRVGIDNPDRHSRTERKEEAGPALHPARIRRKRAISIRSIPRHPPLTILRGNNLPLNILPPYAGRAKQKKQDDNYSFHKNHYPLKPKEGLNGPPQKFC